MITQLIIPHATAAGLQWREYKGYTLVCGDCVDCEVVKGKAVAKSVFVTAIIGKRKHVIESESEVAA